MTGLRRISRLEIDAAATLFPVAESSGLETTATSDFDGSLGSSQCSCSVGHFGLAWAALGIRRNEWPG